ncbi:MAG: hypothetical protein ACJA1R_001704 [Flavobacteriales bacterium]|jgi:hypothetical protein
MPILRELHRSPRCDAGLRAHDERRKPESRAQEIRQQLQIEATCRQRERPLGRQPGPQPANRTPFERRLSLLPDVDPGGARTSNERSGASDLVAAALMQAPCPPPLLGSCCTERTALSPSPELRVKPTAGVDRQHQSVIASPMRTSPHTELKIAETLTVRFDSNAQHATLTTGAAISASASAALSTKLRAVGWTSNVVTTEGRKGLDWHRVTRSDQQENGD